MRSYFNSVKVFFGGQTVTLGRVILDIGNVSTVFFTGDIETRTKIEMIVESEKQLLLSRPQLQIPKRVWKIFYLLQYD